MAFSFENSIENGGEAVKLAFIRAQLNKISQKRLFRDETQAYGSVRRVIERGIGDPWLVDCCVTGSSCGTVISSECVRIDAQFLTHLCPFPSDQTPEPLLVIHDKQVLPVTKAPVVTEVFHEGHILSFLLFWQKMN